MTPRLLIALLWLHGITPGAGAEPLFVDVASAVGIDFRHRNGATGEKHLPETMGSGLAFFDADNDGFVDLYFVNTAGPAAFYRNARDGTFGDETASFLLGDSGLGMGVAAADIDNDGDRDLYVTCYGPNRLFLNNGGRFSDTTVAAGVGDDGFGSGAAFGDVDNDGDLDLYAANYVAFDPENNPVCARVEGVRVYCGPEAYEPQRDRFYRNDGDRSFTDVAAEIGLLPAAAKELGAVFSDFDDDGDLDLYAVGDKTPNLLYRNDGGRFEEIGMLAGMAFSDGGGSLAGMGIAIADYQLDGRLDYFVTNFQWEPNSLYRGLGSGLFADVSYGAGLGVTSLSYMGWGTSFFDYDADGDRDLYAVNGHMDDAFERFDRVEYAQRNQLFRNDGHGAFVEVTANAAPGFAAAHVSRGSAVADFDNDGDLDLAVSNNGGPAELLRNENSGERHWITVGLLGSGSAKSNRDGIGARVEVIAGDLRQIDEVRSGSSYLSQEDTRLHFGLGDRTTVDVVRVRWPAGGVQELANPSVDRFLLMREP